ncbi:MAG: hypothetical protein JSV79_09815 [Armatimonadota bacterium]|nr:MAG: hypothetical protein JSV79_09815 [Armatimonadota bacterium]
MADKVCLQPCLGLRKEAVLGRQALYVIHEDLLPDETVLGCGPALNANVQEDVDFINLYPVLTVEACDLDCATKLVDKKQQRAARTIRIPDLVNELKLDLDALPEEHIDIEDPAVQAVAKRIAEDVKELLTSS